MEIKFLSWIMILLFCVSFVSAVTDADIYPYLQLQLTFETNITYSEEPSLWTVNCLSGNCPSQDGSVKKIGTYSALYDGTNDMLTVAGEPKFIMGGNAGDDSICAWINPHTASYNTNDGWTGRFCPACSDYWYVQIYNSGFISQLNLVGSGVSAGSIVQDDWKFVCFTFADGTDTLSAYLDGSFVTSGVIATDMSDGSGGDLWVGGSGAGINRFKPMNIDNYIWVNKTLSSDEVTYLYNAGSGRTLSSVVIPVVSINTINFTNRSMVYYDGVADERDYYLIFVNATTDNIYDNGLQCNMSGAFSDAFADYYDMTNITITSDNPFTFNFSDIPTNVESESFRFRICRENIVRELEILVNGVSYRNISSVIPQCSGGNYHEELNLSTLTPVTNYNFTLRCPSCIPNNNLRILPIEDFHFLYVRNHINGYHDLSPNDTSQTYYFEDHPHIWTREGKTGINVTCNGTTSEKLMNITNALPIARFSFINSDGTFYNYNLNDTSVEAGDNVQILGDCSGDLISTSNLTIRFFVNNSLIASSPDSEFLNVSGDLLTGQSKFISRLTCVDDELNVTFLDRTFWLNDSVSPTINIINPINDIIVNQTAQVQILAQDINLFGVNISIDCATQQNVFNYLNTSLPSGTTSLYIDSTTLNLTVIGDVCTITYEVCDDHTATDFKFDKINTDSSKSNITIDGKNMLSDYSIYDVQDLTFTQKKDRVNYCYTYTTYEDKFKTKNYKYRIAKIDGWEFRGGSTYSSWDFKNWIDFDTDTGTLSTLDEDKDFYYISVISDFDTICFNSIGGLNCISDNTDNFTVLSPPTIKEDEVIAIGTSILLFVLSVLYLGLLIGGLFFRLFILSGLALLLGVIIGLTLMTYSGLFGVTFILINVVLLVVFAKV